MLKNWRFALLLFCFPIVSHGQDLEGSVKYKETVKIEMDLPPEMEYMRDQIPSERSFEKILEFNASRSLYKDAPAPEDENVFASNGGGARMRMFFQAPDNQVFRNWDEDLLIEKRDFMGRPFLITDQPQSYSWKLTGEQAKVLGYVCHRAEFADSSGVVEAWFTPQIQIPSGPDIYGGLPGLILMMRMDEGKRVIIASEVSLGPLENDLEAPDSGKKMSYAEFDAMMQEKLKEMQAERGGRGGRSGTFIIRN